MLLTRTGDAIRGMSPASSDGFGGDGGEDVVSAVSASAMVRAVVALRVIVSGRGYVGSAESSRGWIRGLVGNDVYIRNDSSREKLFSRNSGRSYCIIWAEAMKIGGRIDVQSGGRTVTGKVLAAAGRQHMATGGLEVFRYVADEVWK